MKLCASGKKAAQAKFRVYPSAYANAYAAKLCKRSKRSPSRYSPELRRWFAERWVNVCEPPPFPSCGTRGRGYPYCRPSRRISAKTPLTVSELSRSELARRCKAKRRLERGHQEKSPRRLLVGRSK